jgi:enoyl-CoA hydratase/carnithine racemase
MAIPDYDREMIDAQEAYRIGPCGKVVPAEELMETAEKVARIIMSKAPIAIRAALTAINTGSASISRRASHLRARLSWLPSVRGQDGRNERIFGKTAGRFRNK